MKLVQTTLENVRTERFSYELNSTQVLFAEGLVIEGEANVYRLIGNNEANPLHPLRNLTFVGRTSGLVKLEGFTQAEKVLIEPVGRARIIVSSTQAYRAVRVGVSDPSIGIGLVGVFLNDTESKPDCVPMEPIYESGTTVYGLSSADYPTLLDGYNNLYTFSDSDTYYYVRVSKVPVDFLAPVRIAFMFKEKMYVSTNMNPSGGAICLPLGTTEVGLYQEGDPSLVISSIVPGPSLLVAGYAGFLSPRSGYVSQV